MSKESKYKTVNGTSYHENTPDALITVLEQARKEKIRVIFDFGDTETKESWGETLDICGYIGRSIGPIKVPILVYNSRSLGGGQISTNRVLSVKTSKGKRVLYSI